MRLCRHFNFRSLQRSILVAAMLLSLAACSVATLAYNNAAILIGFALDDYVELTPRQEIWLKDRVNVLIAWHRAHELPAWQQWLHETRERAAGTPQADDVQAAYARGRHLLARTTELMLPDMALLLQQLDASQVAALEHKFSRDNQKLADDIARPLEKRRAKRLERMRERFESSFGDLTREQIDYLESQISAMVMLDEMRLADRQRWQHQLIELIKARPGLPQIQATLRSMILQPEQGRDPAYQAEVSRQQQQMMAITAWILGQATPAQKKHLQKKFTSYAEDISRLLRT